MLYVDARGTNSTGHKLGRVFNWRDIIDLTVLELNWLYRKVNISLIIVAIGSRQFVMYSIATKYLIYSHSLTQSPSVFTVYK